MNPFDSDMASFIHSEVRKHGVKLMLGHTVEGFAEQDGGVNVLLKDFAPLSADMVVLAIGVTPESTLAKEAGLALGIKGSILVNDRMETSEPDIYAVGDAVQVKHFVTEQNTLIARDIRALGVYTEIHPHDITAEQLAEDNEGEEN